MSKTNGYANRAQISALVAAMEDAKGNKDGLVRNEALPKNSAKTLSFVDKNPLLHKGDEFVRAGLTTTDDEARLDRFVAAQEASWHMPTTKLTDADTRDLKRLRTEKAIALTRFDRTPAEVTEGFVEAKGTVDGQPIPTRDVFWQRWKPIGKPSGKVVVISPGFQETGRNFYEQVNLLNKAGHDVVVLDHQWAGYSSGRKGSFDRGFGLARDVAAIAAFASELQKKEYPRGSVVLMGNSMGAGPGVLAAAAMNDAGGIKLDGPQMPKGLDLILQAPFLEATKNVANVASRLGSRIPMVREMKAPAVGLPVITENEVAQAKFAQHAVAENVEVRLEAMSRADADIAKTMGVVAKGKGPTGNVYIIHSAGDTLAASSASEKLAKLLGDRAHLEIVPGRDHILEEHPLHQRLVLDAMTWLNGR